MSFVLDDIEREVYQFLAVFAFMTTQTTEDVAPPPVPRHPKESCAIYTPMRFTPRRLRYLPTRGNASQGSFSATYLKRWSRLWAPRAIGCNSPTWIFQSSLTFISSPSTRLLRGMQLTFSD